MIFEVYNPNDRPLNELPTIYGFNYGGHEDFLEGVLLAEDGTYLGGHICSNESFMLSDLGILKGARPDRHEGFRKKYPDGYKMEFVSYEKVRFHTGLQKIKNNFFF